MRKFVVLFFALLVWSGMVSAKIVHIVYVSDTHYGITRSFRGEDGVAAQVVNQAMIEKINLLPSLTLPKSKGVGAGEVIGAIEMVINTGDITNRMQEGVLPAATSWSQFVSDYSTLLNVKNSAGADAPMALSAGNHECSNFVGLRKIVQPLDATPLVGIYNLMMNPQTPLTCESYDYDRHKIHYSFEFEGVRFLFVHLWADSCERQWIERELQYVDPSQPVLLFSHDAPKVEVKHLRSPFERGHVDKFENILNDVSSVATTKDYPAKEVDELADFLRSKPQIKGYFHGDDNYSEFYKFFDSRGKYVLPVFRVDSPMKGAVSRDFENELSFMLISIDTDTKELTAREVLWNRRTPIVWGDHKTISLEVTK